MLLASPASGVAGAPSQGSVGCVALPCTLLQRFLSHPQQLHALVLVQTRLRRGRAALPTRSVWTPACTKCPGLSELLSCFTSKHHKSLRQHNFSTRNTPLFFSQVKASDTNYSFGKEEILQTYPQLPLSPAVPTVSLIWFPSYTWATSSRRGP